MAPMAANVNVFITGFGPYPKFDGSGGVYEHNSSHLTTQLLPSSLPPSHPANSTGCTINLINPTALPGQYVKVSYAYIRTYISDLHDAHKDDVDLFVHIGMAGGFDHVTIERRAFKQGFSSSWWGPSAAKGYYMMEDVKGETVLDAGKNPWGDDVPWGLGTGLDVDGKGLNIDGIAESANKILTTRDGDSEAVESKDGKKGEEMGLLLVKPHHEAGAYGCGFMTYESLANRFVKGTKGHVLFCHVPGDIDNPSLEKARDALVAIIGSAVDNLLKERERQKS